MHRMQHIEYSEYNTNFYNQYDMLIWTIYSSLKTQTQHVVESTGVLNNYKTYFIFFVL